MPKAKRRTANKAQVMVRIKELKFTNEALATVYDRIGLFLTNPLSCGKLANTTFCPPKPSLPT